MIVDINVTQHFIDQRNERATKYNPNGRSQNKLLKDIECEILEWAMIETGVWEDDDSWMIDGHTAEYGAVDVKFIQKWYNISRKKLTYILKQRDAIDNFLFAEWVDRPNRLLEDGDKVKVKIIGTTPYWTVLDNLRESNYPGFYVDARKLAKKETSTWLST